MTTKFLALCKMEWNSFGLFGPTSVVNVLILLYHEFVMMLCSLWHHRTLSISLDTAPHGILINPVIHSGGSLA